MLEPRVSVIIPAYRSAKTIGRALRSISHQTLLPFEVVVVDDGSEDQTAAVAESLRSELGSITLIVIKQENMGAGAARNRAIMGSSGSLLAFLDADDEWLPTKLERSIEELDKGGHSLVGHNSLIVDAGKETLNNCARRFLAPDDPYENLYRKGFIDTCTVVAKRDLVFSVGGFDETLRNAQDFDMWLAMLKDPKETFLIFDDVLCRSHVTPRSIMSYTERRRSCALKIAVRYIFALQSRGIKWFPALCFRVLAIHYEALSAHWVRGRFIPAALILPKLLFALVGALISVFYSKTYRPEVLSK